MRTENDLRSALRSLEREAPSAEQVLRHLTERSGHTMARRGPRPPRRLVAAAAAAAAVIAIVVTTALVTGSAGPVAPPSAREALRRVPRYYMALVPPGPVTDGLISQTYAVVRDTVTGRTLATVLPPKPYVTINWVSGADDDRTFVLAAQSTVQAQPDKFYEARFNPARDAVTLTPLTLPGLPASGGMAEVALSPDGTKLAVASDNDPVKITVYALPSGTARTWTGPVDGPQPFGLGINDHLSWSTTGTLAYGLSGSVYLLRMNRPAGELVADSRQVLCLPPSVSGGNLGWFGYLTPDATTIIAPVRQSVPIGERPPSCQNPTGSAPLPSAPVALEEFSVMTGQATSIIRGSLPGHISLDGTVYWTDSSGSVMVLAGEIDTGRHLRQVQGISIGGRFFPIPGASGGWITGTPPAGSPPLIVQMAF